MSSFRLQRLHAASKDCTRRETAIFDTFVPPLSAATMYRDNSVRSRQPPAQDKSSWLAAGSLSKTHTLPTNSTRSIMGMFCPGRE